MVKHTSANHVIPVLLLACGAWCQNAGTAPGVSDSRQHPQPEMRPSTSIPDAPSTPGLNLAKEFGAVSEKMRASWNFSAAGAGRLQSVFPDPAGSVEAQSTSLDKYLYRLLRKPDWRLPQSTDVRVLDKATDPFSWILLTRDDSGKRTLNTSYLFRRLLSATMETASQPYWSRSNSAPLDNLSSDVGTDMGISLFHEIRPGIQQILSAQSPSFVKKLEGRIVKQLTPIESSHREQPALP